MSERMSPTVGAHVAMAHANIEALNNTVTELSGALASLVEVIDKDMAANPDQTATYGGKRIRYAEVFSDQRELADARKALAKAKARQ